MRKGKSYKKARKSHGEGRRGNDADDRMKKSSSSSTTQLVVGVDDGPGMESRNNSVFGSMTVDEKLSMIAELSEQVLEDPTKAFHQERVTTTTHAPPSDDTTEKKEEEDNDDNDAANIKIRKPLKLHKVRRLKV